MRDRLRLVTQSDTASVSGVKAQAVGTRVLQMMAPFLWLALTQHWPVQMLGQLWAAGL